MYGSTFFVAISISQFYLNVISKLHACTFVTCSLNVIDWSQCTR